MMVKLRLLPLFLLFSTSSFAHNQGLVPTSSPTAQVALSAALKPSVHDKKAFVGAAQRIRDTYEPNLYTLPAFKAGHYGLRMFRQTLDMKYSATIWSDMARVAHRLNRFAFEINTHEKIMAYSEARLDGYRDETGERSKRRLAATQAMPEYLYLGVGLLGSMARANEYGLQHREDHALRTILRQYDFNKYATNPKMIEAWAAQLANQVYWLRQLGEQDVIENFTRAFREVYPDSRDATLSAQQYGNKLYGMTHIIFGDSEYYQHQVSEQKHQWIYDYFRRNIDHILQHAKEDIIAEVGLSFLLAGLDDDPVVLKTRRTIAKAIDAQRGMIPSTKGSFNLKTGEHRNVLAIMLLDWQGVHHAPTYQQHPQVFRSIPFGLMPITSIPK